MSWSQSHAEDDLGSHGWHSVRTFLCQSLRIDGLLDGLNSLTNDGNAILREIDVAHPAAKNMIELSRTQDEECGDGTTSVIVLGAYALYFMCNLSFLNRSSRRDSCPVIVPT